MMLSYLNNCCIFIILLGELEEKQQIIQDSVQDPTVDIGSNTHVNKSILDDIKSDYRHVPGIFMRKLMLKTGLFTLEELAASSLTGQKHRDGTSRPALDRSKFLICKGEFCLLFEPIL